MPVFGLHAIGLCNLEIAWHQGCIELPKAVRGYATSYSARTDGMVLSVTKKNVSG